MAFWSQLTSQQANQPTKPDDVFDLPPDSAFFGGYGAWASLSGGEIRSSFSGWGNANSAARRLHEQPPLLEAASSGACDLLRLLIENKAPVGTKNATRLSRSALYKAARRNQADAMKL